jgi:hypothetical protein
VPQRDLSLPPEEEQRLAAAAASALDEIVRSPQRRRFGVVRSDLYRWLTLRFAGWYRARWAWAAVPAAAAVVAVVVLSLVLTGRSVPAQALTPPMPVFAGVDNAAVPLRGEDAAPMLRQLAQAAASQPDELAEGDVQFVRNDGWWFTPDVDPDGRPIARELVPARSDHYYLPNGQMRVVELLGAPLDPAGGLVRDDGKWVQNADETFDGGEMGPLYTQTLSTDPAVLVDQLVPDPAGCRTIALCLALSIEQLHQTYVIGPELRAAMWSAFASVEGVWFLGETQDRLGRPALGFVFDSFDGQQHILYADQDTGAYLGYEAIITEDSEEFGLEAPAVLHFIALAEARWIDSSDLP